MSGSMTVEDAAGVAGAGPAPAPAGAGELAELMGHAARRLRLGMRDALAPLGLSGSQARVVRLLAGGPLRMATIADRLGVVPRTATDMVDSVDAVGLVARHADPDDRRSVLVELTASGRTLVERLDQARLESARRVFDVLDAGEREAMLAMLRAMCDRGACPVCAAQPAPASTTDSACAARPAGAVAPPADPAARGLHR